MLRHWLGPAAPLQLAWGPFAREVTRPRQLPGWKVAQVTFVPPGQMQGATMALLCDCSLDLHQTISDLSPTFGDALHRWLLSLTIGFWPLITLPNPAYGVHQSILYPDKCQTYGY